MLDDGSRTFAYDASNRLISVTTTAATIQFEYNGLSDRTAQTSSGQETRYTLDPSGLAQVLIEATNSQTNVYLSGLAQYQGDAWVYQLPDHLGSARQVVDGAGQVTLGQSYDPFGNILEQGGSGASGFGYTGEQEDAGTGLVFLRARYYDPATGRFVSKDPWPGSILRPHSLHGYSYVANNPANLTDPSGADYVWDVDRYTCDDSHARGGYVHHLDKATGTWGGWPCIVNPANLPLGHRPYVIPEGHPDYPVPSGPPAGQDSTTQLPTGSASQPPISTKPLPPHQLADALKGANGYVEGRVRVLTLLLCVVQIEGEEIVYDFETRERQKFTYTEARGYQKGLPIIPPGLAFSLAGASEAVYGGFLWGFSDAGISADYSGYFVGTSLGYNKSIFSNQGLDGSAAIGWGQFTGSGNKPFASVTGEGVVSGDVVYFGAGVSGPTGKLKIPVDASLAGTWYTTAGDPLSYPETNEGLLQMLNHVRTGDGSPIKNFPLILPVPISPQEGAETNIRNIGAAIGANTFIRKGWVK